VSAGVAGLLKGERRGVIASVEVLGIAGPEAVVAV
jgi:hypothetical protein